MRDTTESIQPELQAKLDWRVQEFTALSGTEVYKIMAARHAVFVLEQQCFYVDADFIDPACLHLCAWQQDQLGAYARIVPPGVNYVEAAIGRVLTTELARSLGLGRELMRRAIAATHARFGICPIRIGAQQHLQRFYASLGFVVASDVYDEDGIAHVEMLRPATAVEDSL
jgi:ElaA protein